MQKRFACTSVRVRDDHSGWDDTPHVDGVVALCHAGDDFCPIPHAAHAEKSSNGRPRHPPRPRTRANTWVWGTGMRANSAIGTCAESCVVTLGDGVNLNDTESTVAVGSEYTDAYSFDVYALTHPELAVDHLPLFVKGAKKPAG